MKVTDNVLPELIGQLEQSSDYRARRTGNRSVQQGSRFLKKGIALTPVKFGISFTIPTMNQAGALVHVYRDGSIHLNHGGTEMGQGLFVKIAQIVAEAFGVSLDRVKITATNTGKVPNTSPTAASAGSDINGMAALAAANTIRKPHRGFCRRASQGAARPNRLPRRPGRRRQPRHAVRGSGRGRLSRAQAAVGDRLLRDAHDRLRPRQALGQAVLLFRLWRRLLGSHDRHNDRRDADSARRSPARLRTLAQSRRRSRPDRGRVSCRALAG
jgi:hypothetical protein